MNIKKSIYKRIILKISGEVLKGNKKFGIDIKVVNYIVNEIKFLLTLKVQIGIVIGGGNIFRGKDLKKIKINNIISDHIGMLSTIINSLAIYDIFKKNNINSYLMSEIPIKSICEKYDHQKANNLLNNNIVVIFSGGLGQAYFTTDSSACLKAIETNSNILLKSTKVDGVYLNDPKKNNNLIKFDKLSYDFILRNRIKIMDLTAITLAYENNLSIIVFNFYKKKALYNIIIGINEGTLISN